MFVPSIVVLSLLTGCGPQRLPPPAAPAKVLPADLDVPDAPPPEGTSRVVIDTDQQAKVVEITGATTAMAGGYRATIVGTRSLCTTPCVIDLSYGTHSILLRSVTDETRQSEAELVVSTKPKVFRHTLGEHKAGGALRTVGGSLVGLGVLTALTGAVLWGVAAASNSASNSSAPRSSLEGTGQMITGIGIGAMALGIPFMLIDRPTERPGATTEWTSPGSSNGTPAERSLPPAAGGTRL